MKGKAAMHPEIIQAFQHENERIVREITEKPTGHSNLSLEYKASRNLELLQGAES